MSSPSRDASESMLKKLDPTTENGLETTKTSLESYFGNKAINSSNAGLIASALLTGTPLSSYNHASEWTIEANLSTIFESVLQQFGNAVRTQMLNGIANAHHGEISEPVVEFDSQTMQVSVKLKSETNTVARHNTYKANGVALKTKKLSVVSNTTIQEPEYTGNLDAAGNLSVDPTAGRPNPREMVSTTSCTKKTCVQADDDEHLKGERYLSSTIDKILREQERQMLQRTKNVLRSANRWEPDEEGTQKWEILENNYGKRANLTMNQITNYSNFLNRERLVDETMDALSLALQDAATKLNRKQWTLDELIVVKLYSILKSAEDVTPRGVKVKYDDLLKEMKKSFKTKTFISPTEVQMGIDEAIRDAKSTDKEEERKGKALMGKRKRENSDFGKDKKKEKKKKNEKKKWEPPKLQDSTKQFTEKARWCSKCRSDDNKASLPWHGWSEEAINGRQPHFWKHHDKVINKE